MPCKNITSILQRSFRHGLDKCATDHCVLSPGSHINPMMNLCKLLVSKKNGSALLAPTPSLITTYVLKQSQMSSHLSCLKPPIDFPAFYEAVMTKMEAPFEQLLDGLEVPVTAILGDIEVRWGTGVRNRRNIAVALLRTIFHRDDRRVLELALDCISRVRQAQYLLFTSVYEFEPQVFDSLRAIYYFPVYSIGPAIHYLELRDHVSCETRTYLQWLDSQQAGSVLYISLGSFLSMSNTQMDEILAGLQISGVRYLWVARGEASRLKDRCGDMD
ncbi:hypothetical protein PTKIN_Ptkin16aG0064600 [Pterospermum kingtungense]